MLKDFDIDIKNSFVVGDMGMNDMVLAKNAHAKAILVLTGVGKSSLNEFFITDCSALHKKISGSSRAWVIHIRGLYRLVKSISKSCPCNYRHIYIVAKQPAQLNKPFSVFQSISVLTQFMQY